MPLVMIGVFAPVSAHMEHSAWAPSTPVGACVCKDTFKHIPQPLKSHMQSP